ncbi:MAG: carboxypeptidase regulatory-like domain-containing protein [Planctomycetes bacterium]|nr:carboxypeptidase regulatory-like domain-containing protein [Planctomycetota bacterium]
MQSVRGFILGGLFLWGAIAPVGSASAAEIAILTADNWNAWVPAGKEVDAIYGDIVIRNDKLVAVIAQPLVTRNANMTVKNVGGCLLDFTTREGQNDQLGAWYPLGKAANWRTVTTTPAVSEQSPTAKAERIVVRVGAVIQEGKLTAETTYELADGDGRLAVTTTFKNSTDKPIDYDAADEIRADGTVYTKGTAGALAWNYDRWWNAAYGVIIDQPEGNKPSATSRKLSIPAGGTAAIARHVYVASDLNQLLQVAGAANEPGAKPAVITVTDEAGKPLAGAYVELKQDDKVIAAGKTGSDGMFIASLTAPAKASVSSPHHGERTLEVTAGGQHAVKLPTAGTVVASVTNQAGGPIPCKVQFRGAGDTKNPNFFDKSGEHAVGNLYYSHTGAFRLELPPGKYDCTVSYGPEYDIVEQQLEVLAGSETRLSAKLIRTVDTRGWVSGDFHNHASPSGDNISSQYGRVLNLLCEHVEYAPCTEHNRISTYVPHLKRLGVEHLMGTCTGIELTSSPLPLGHMNSFPLHMHDHTQDNGAPLPDADPQAQIERLALWDNRSEKLVQQNHPDLGWLLFDKNGDGKPDEGYQRVLAHMDVVEVHPPQNIFKPALIDGKDGQKNNTIFNWLQLLNQGARVPGVVNTDAHYNIHGSGWLRNWIECPTDDPAKIEVLDIVHAAEHGHIVMSNGPFLEVNLQAAQPGPRSQGTAGDDIDAPTGKATLSVRVQCANWLDVDRVQVFINGAPQPELNFTRKSHPDMFGSKVVKFEQKIPLALKSDAHVIVATIGEQSKLGHVMGPEHAKTPPVAVSNPIYVDVDGQGFKPNQDTLGAPLPVKSPGSKK